MKRPFVQIEHTKNSAKYLKNQLKNILPDIQTLPGIVGITLNGGISRGYADDLSEIDITIFLNSSTYFDWCNNISPITLGITKINKFLFDIKILDFEKELEKDWDEVELWDLSYAEILFDPDKKIKKLFKKKLISEKTTMSKAEGLMFSCWWHYRLAGDIWIKRGDPVQGHIMLNEAAIQIVKILFIANNEYIPHEKWLIHMSRTLTWKPENWEKRLIAIFSTSNMSQEGLKERQKIIMEVWDEVNKYLNKIYFKIPLLVMHNTFYNLLRKLFYEKRMKVSEWKKDSSIAVLNKDPFHKIIKIDNDEIVLDIEKMKKLGNDDMYQWHLEILEAVRREL